MATHVGFRGVGGLGGGHICRESYVLVSVCVSVNGFGPKDTSGPIDGRDSLLNG